MTKKQKIALRSNVRRPLATAFLTVLTLLTFFLETANADAPNDSTVPPPNAVAAPNPGDDWLLPPKRDDAPNAETPPIFAFGEILSDAAILTEIVAVGRIVKIDATEIETENRRTASTERFKRRPGGAILFRPPVDPNEAAKFCRKIREERENRDQIWLRNGDEFVGTLLAVDRRRVFFRAFGVDVAIPRGRVRAVRFADD